MFKLCCIFACTNQEILLFMFYFRWNIRLSCPHFITKGFLYCGGVDIYGPALCVEEHISIEEAEVWLVVITSFCFIQSSTPSNTIRYTPAQT